MNFRNLKKRIIFVSVVAALISCGGGGGGSNIQSSNPVLPPTEHPNLLASKYQGAYLDSCQLLDSATNLTTNKPLYYQFYKEVAATSSATASYTWRVHLYDTTDCSGGVVGLIQNLSATNQFTVLGQVNIAGKLIDQVMIKIGGLNGTSITSVIGQQNQQVLLDGAFKLSLPANLLFTAEIADLLLLENNKLFYGNDVYGANGFPTAIESIGYATKLSAPLALPAAPCGGGGAGWQASVSLTCSGSLRPTTSGSTIDVINTNGVNKGSAKFQCVDGVWSQPLHAVCESTYVFCPIETLTWTVGGLTCSGPVRADASRVPGDNLLVGSSVPRGSALFLCDASGKWVDHPNASQFNTCETAPPPPPPITDPLQLATSKNCMVCHTVDSPLTFQGAALAPSFKQVSDRYRNNPPAAGLLEGRIKNGVVGIYSTTPMPANPQVTDADLAIIVPWILTR